MVKIIRYGLILSALTFYSCTNKKELLLNTSSCSNVTIKYSNDISIIIQTSCATNSSCHAAGSFNGPGSLLNYTDVRNAAAAIENAVITKRMPQGSTLSDAEINKIKCWVESGSPNN